MVYLYLYTCRSGGVFASREQSGRAEARSAADGLDVPLVLRMGHLAAGAPDQSEGESDMNNSGDDVW